jgi:hypothetical protein
MPSTPPLPSNAETPSTPPTSPQRHQQAARNQERNQRLIGSPEQRRTPAIPSRPSTPPLHPPAPSSVIVDGRELTHLPHDIRMLMSNIPPHPILRRHGRAPSPPPPPPPPLDSAVGSSSVAPALGSGFIPLPPPPPLSSTRETLNPAQLRAAYVPAPIPTRSRGRPPVSHIYLKLSINVTILIII